MLSFNSIDIFPRSYHAFPGCYIVTANLIMLLLIFYLDWIKVVFDQRSDVLSFVFLLFK